MAKESEMDKQELKGVIDSIIDATFTRLNNVYKTHREGLIESTSKATSEGSRLVFPMYGVHRGFETRISEQELRFAFVESFNDYCRKEKINLFYSIETPTKMRTYSNFTTSPRDDDENGRSAEFDLVIYNDELERVCLIEFKANNADEIDHKKDFLKLNNIGEGNEDVLRYFIEIVKSYNKGTIDNLNAKLSNNKSIKAIFRCYALEGKSRKKEKKGEDISQHIVNE